MENIFTRNTVQISKHFQAVTLSDNGIVSQEGLTLLLVYIEFLPVVRYRDNFS